MTDTVTRTQSHQRRNYNKVNTSRVGGDQRLETITQLNKRDDSKVGQNKRSVNYDKTTQIDRFRNLSNKPYKNNPRFNKHRKYEKTIIPKAVQEQSALCKRYKYVYVRKANGNVYNNSTIYVDTQVAHKYQIEKLFNDALEKAKQMPEIFGKDFECDIMVNLVRNRGDEYLGYAFVDVTNPVFYYVILGLNPDGTERALYVDDVGKNNSVNGKLTITKGGTISEQEAKNYLTSGSTVVSMEKPPWVSETANLVINNTGANNTESDDTESDNSEPNNTEPNDMRSDKIPNGESAYNTVSLQDEGKDKNNNSLQYLADDPMNKTENYSSWADDVDDECSRDYTSHKTTTYTKPIPKTKYDIEPLLKLGKYEFDEFQKLHYKNKEKEGSVRVSPGFINPGVDTSIYYDRTLYVSDVPVKDYDFLYTLFARYARYSDPIQSDGTFYPKIVIKESRKKTLFATVTYQNAYDTAFALTMLQKIRANYRGKDIQMSVRYAKKLNYNKDNQYDTFSENTEV